MLIFIRIDPNDKSPETLTQASHYEGWNPLPKSEFYNKW
jgi:hypothetical protein